MRALKGSSAPWRAIGDGDAAGIKHVRATAAVLLLI
jgi:hypothetical protein